MAQLVPVQGDPFGAAPQNQATDSPAAGTKLVPVQGDPFAADNQYQRGGMDAASNGVLQGMTLGFGDELMAGALSPIEAVKGAVTGEDQGKGFLQRMGDSYDRALTKERADLHQDEQQHPYLSTAGNLAGGLALGNAAQDAGLTFLKGSPSILKGTAEGLTYGGLQGFGSGEGSAQARVTNALTGAKWGGASGGTIGVVGKAVPAIANYAQAYFDPQLGSMSKPALDYARRNISPDMLQSMRDLGSLSTLADVSPEWLGVARGAAAIPDSRGIVVQPLLDRQAGANGRLASDLNASLGPVTPPAQINAQIGQNLDVAGQQYGPLFAQARAVNTEPLAANLETNAVNLRGPAQQATQRVRNMLDITGAPGQLDPSPNTLFQTRQAIDGMLQTEADPKAIRALTDARNQVDAQLQASVPGIKDTDAQYQQLMQQRDALQQGSSVLDSGKTGIRPDELQAKIQDMMQPNGTLVGPSAAPLRLQQGVRAEIDRNLGTAANDPVAFQRLMKGEGDWNRDKLAMVFDPQAADAALAAGDREARFNTTTNRVSSGSDTGMTQGFREALNKLQTPTELPPNLTALGMLGWAGNKALNAFRTQNTAQRVADFTNDLGRLSVAQGTPRDRLVNALLNYQAGKTNPLSPAAQAVYDALVRGTGQNFPTAVQASPK